MGSELLKKLYPFDRQQFPVFKNRILREEMLWRFGLSQLSTSLNGNVPITIRLHQFNKIYHILAIKLYKYTIPCMSFQNLFLP
jgi:hypothetical protein